ncbi:MAG: lipopolysaccharide heptosyltransferase II [Planctomycetales bacterium]|nr:lipopolysaccharide heptosyltransferase II [Planctomycetales bacterium]
MNTLIRMPNWLGDAVMATPALRCLLDHARDRLGRDSAAVVVGSPAVAEMLSGLDAHVVADPSKGWRRAGGNWRLGRRLRREHGPFAWGVAFTASFPTRLMLSASGAPVRVGARRGLADALLTQAVTIDNKLHVAEFYQRIADHVISPDGTATSTGATCLPTPWRKSPANLASPSHRPFVAINPGATYGSAKRWPPDRFAEVARALGKSHDVVIVGGPGEREMGDHIERRLIEWGVAGHRNLVGKTSLRELMEWLDRAELLVTNDSGPMHIANALGTPLVAIFGPTNHLKTCPWRGEAVELVRRPVACAPCMKRRCPFPHHACMNDIPSADVIAAAQRLLCRHQAA